jgi:GAF domain-containing protein
MNKTFLQLPKGLTNQARSALLIIAAYLCATLVASIPLIIQLLKAPSWQLWAAEISVFAVTIASGIALRLVWRGRLEAGIWLTTSAALITGFILTATFSGLGIIFFISSVTLNTLIALQTLQRRQATSLTTVGISAGILILFVDFFIPTQRLSISGLQTLIYAISAGMLLLFAYFISRQFRDYSLRTKLIIAFILVSAMSVSVVAFITNRITQNELTANVQQSLAGQANLTAFAIGDELDKQVDELRAFALNEVMEVELGNASAAASGDVAEMERLNQQWLAADAAGNDAHPLVQMVLNHPIAEELHELQETFPQHAEVFVTDRYGANVAATNRTSDYYQADEEWWQVAYNKGEGAVFIGQPEFDESSQTLGLQMAVPVFSEGGEVVGVLRTTIDLAILAESLEAGRFGQTGRTEIYLPDGTELELEQETDGTFELTLGEAAPDFLAVLQTGEVILDTTHMGVPIVGAQTSLIRGEDEPEDAAALERLDWRLVSVQDRAEALQPVTYATRAILLTGLGTLLAAGLLAVGATRFLTGSIARLTAVANQVTAGNLKAQADVEVADEIGTLATAFNTMTSQLRGLIGSLEQRVAERTRNLELAAEVGRSVSQVRALDVMLKDAAEIIRSQFDLYYAQVYLTDPGQTNLILQSGTGTVGAQLIGRGHRLPLDTESINGRAAIEKRPVIVADTAASSTFRPNPLLPETRSEMAVPLLVGEKVVGVLDLQSKQAGALSPENLPAFEALAGQLAIAIQNANLLTETEQARAEVEKHARRLVRKGWDEHLDAIHKPEQFGFMFDHKAITPLAAVEFSQLAANDQAISAPIALTGEALGSLVVEIDDEARREQTLALINAVAPQVAQQIENLRLLESAERYRYEAEKAARLQTIEGWQKFIESRSQESLGYLYDTKEVRPQGQGNGRDENLSMFALPLKARDETIGKLSVQGLTYEDPESVELVNAVAERLGAHIENLRLFEETRLGQLELDKRARQLAAVAGISTASSQELEVDKLLDTVVHLTQRQFGLYHAHIFTYREAKQELQITACGWKEGDEHEGTHETVSIPLSKEQSLVARAARTRQAVIANDVHKEPGWLPNPLLPDTAAEMAVPLIIGEQLLGVLDVQSDRLNAFTDEDANIQTTLASQVATSLQNARSFTRAQKQAERESMLNAISQKIQSATTVEAVLQIAARELGHALHAPLTVAQLGMKANGNAQHRPTLKGLPES